MDVQVRTKTVTFPFRFGILLKEPTRLKKKSLCIFPKKDHGESEGDSIHSVVETANGKVKTIIVPS